MEPKWQFPFDEWGDRVNLASVACTRAKKILSLPPCILQYFDALHQTVNDDSEDVIDEPNEKDRKVHAQLVLPLRKDFDLVEGQTLICDQLLNCPEELVDKPETVVIDDGGGVEEEKDQDPPAKKAKRDTTASAATNQADETTAADGSNAACAEILD